MKQAIKLSDVRIYVLSLKNLEDRERIDSARALLYQTYVVELKWEPSVNNPSGIKTIKDNKSGRMLFVDNFDEHARWIVAEYNGEVIACARSCKPINGKFEAQLYPNASCLQAVFDQYPNINLEEVTRGAVLKAHRLSGVYLKLLYEGFKKLNEDHISIFSLVPIKEAQILYRQIGFPEIEGVAFKYEERDEHNAQLFLAVYEEGHLSRMVRNLHMLLSATIMAKTKNVQNDNIFAKDDTGKSLNQPIQNTQNTQDSLSVTAMSNRARV